MLRLGMFTHVNFISRHGKDAQTNAGTCASFDLAYAFKSLESRADDTKKQSKDISTLRYTDKGT